jgi:hypothetical protein
MSTSSPHRALSSNLRIECLLEKGKVKDSTPLSFQGNIEDIIFVSRVVKVVSLERKVKIVDCR